MFDKSDFACLDLSRKSGYTSDVVRTSIGVRSRVCARVITRTCLSRSDTSFRRAAIITALSFKTSI